MEQQKDGLNFVPMLTQSLTPPSSGRSRISLARNRSQRSVVFYNGNYEGDSSMFREKLYELERLSLVDSESDTELSRDATVIEAGKMKEKKGITWRLIHFLLVNFLKPETSEKLLKRLEHFRQSTFYRIITKWTKVITAIMAYILHFVLLLSKHLGRFFCKQRAIFHNLVRRLLWRLTLAKCSDLWLFAYVLISLPFLFALSLMGFIISICGGLKNAFCYGIHQLKKIQLN